MNYRVVQINEITYLEYLPGGGAQIATDRDAVDLVGLCGENETHRLMLHAESLTPDFFRLRTGVAGSILLKFANYRLKVALVAPPELTEQGRFREMVRETNRGDAFRVFAERAAAHDWLVSPSQSERSVIRD